MKDSKSLLARHFALSILLQILAVVVIALPPLADARAAAAQALRMPPTALWIPILGLLILGNALLMRRLGTFIVEPLVHLVNQTKLGASTFAFKKKSMNAEEDTLKHFIEAQALRHAEMEQEVIRMEEVAQRAEEVSRITPLQLAEIEGKLEAAAIKADKNRQHISNLEKAKADLERQVDELKRELKHRYRELEDLREGSSLRPAPAERADGGSLSSLLAERLKGPLSLISNLSWRLSKSWAELPPAQIRDGLQEISQHAEEQLEVLKKYQTSKPADDGRNAI